MNTGTATAKVTDTSMAAMTGSRAVAAGSPPAVEPSQAPVYSTVLIATVDPDIRREMRELLEPYPVKVLWAKGVEEVRWLLSKERVTACFCGFWLVDGTYRDVVRHLRSQPVEIPAAIVCAPDCPHEYRDYLAALKIRAFDFICHPYRKSDVAKILPLAFGPNFEPARAPASFEEPGSEMRQGSLPES